jgi:hypothetical protein
MPETPNISSPSNGATEDDGTDAELQAMMKVSEAVSSLKNAAARDRVLSWAAQKFRSTAGPPLTPGNVPSPQEHTTTPEKSAREIPGIARLSEAGELHLTVRDTKASSANDAALRIAHLLIYATEQLTGAGTISSKSTLNPTLRKYRVYDGNTRTVLARHRGLIREGDELSMDLHCRQEAEGFVAEILDPATQGTWNPSSKTSKRRANHEKPSDAARVKPGVTL